MPKRGVGREESLSSISFAVSGISVLPDQGWLLLQKIVLVWHPLYGHLRRDATGLLRHHGF
jgi:hypothetical protein